MNTNGMIRGLLSKNKSVEDFLKTVVKAIGQEFDRKITLNEKDHEFIIKMLDYELKMSKEQASDLQSPYGLDRYILEEFRKQGFEFDIARSQYIQYCYGNYIGAKVHDRETGEDVQVEKLITEFPNKG